LARVRIGVVRNVGKSETKVSRTQTLIQNASTILPERPMHVSARHIIVSRTKVFAILGFPIFFLILILWVLQVNKPESATLKDWIALITSIFFVGVFLYIVSNRLRRRKGLKDMVSALRACLRVAG